MQSIIALLKSDLAAETWFQTDKNIKYAKHELQVNAFEMQLFKLSSSIMSDSN